MLKSVLAAALAAGLVVALAPPGLAGSEIKVGAGGSFQTADAAAAENEGLRGEVAGREGQDRREGPHYLSEIHG
jgi:hypothetical protein